MCMTKPCPNPRCVDGLDHGYIPGDDPPRDSPRTRCCSACDGRGYVSASESENRGHYYRLVGVAEELAFDARERARVIGVG